MANGHGNVNGKCNTAKTATTIPSIKWCLLIFWTNKELTFDHIHIIRRLISRNKGTIYSLFLFSNDKNFENVNVLSVVGWPHNITRYLICLITLAMLLKDGCQQEQTTLLCGLQHTHT